MTGDVDDVERQKDVGSAPAPVRWYRRHTSGLTRRYVLWGALVAFVTWALLALLGWCRS